MILFRKYLPLTASLFKAGVLCLLFIFFFFPLFAQSKTPDQFPVVSYRNLKVKELNLQITTAEKNQEAWVLNPLSIAMRFHKVSDVRFVDINQKNDRAEYPSKSVVTIIEEGFLDDQMRGRWIELHLERKDCSRAWRIKELRQAFLCGREGSDEVFLKDLCPEPQVGYVTDVSVEMIPATVDIPCDYFPYTFDVKFSITVDGKTEVIFQRMRSDGAKAPEEKVIFEKKGQKEFYDYFRVGSPGDYWFRVEVLQPNQISGQASGRVICILK
jgi:hypothetical protein